MYQRRCFVMISDGGLVFGGVGGSCMRLIWSSSRFGWYFTVLRGLSDVSCLFDTKDDRMPVSVFNCAS